MGPVGWCSQWEPNLGDKKVASVVPGVAQRAGMSGRGGCLPSLGPPAVPSSESSAPEPHKESSARGRLVLLLLFSGDSPLSL